MPTPADGHPAVSDPDLKPIAEKVVAAVPLSADDGLALFATRDVYGLGRLANFARERLHGDQTFYNRNRHINYTNVCALSCKFCSFYRKRGEAGAYEMPVDQVIATAVKAAEAGATEVHVVGGLHPWLKFDYYTDVLAGIRAAAPGLHIKAFTAIEIVHLARISHQSVEQVLVALRDAGLGSLPGRRGRDLRRPRARCRVQGQGAGRPVVRRPPHGPPAGHLLQRDDAVRATSRRRPSGSGI